MEKTNEVVEVVETETKETLWTKIKDRLPEKKTALKWGKRGAKIIVGGLAAIGLYDVVTSFAPASDSEDIGYDSDNVVDFPTTEESTDEAVS